MDKRNWFILAPYLLGPSERGKNVRLSFLKSRGALKKKKMGLA